MNLSTLQKRIILFLFAYAVMGIIIYLFSFAINDDLDWKIMEYFNPDNRIPVLDEFMIAITDFSMFLMAVLLISWEIGYVLYHKKVPTERFTPFYRGLGGILAIICSSGYWWGGYFYPSSFLFLGVFIMIGFEIVARSFTTYSHAQLARFSRLFWVILFAAGFGAIMETIIKETVQRPRPLNDVNTLLAVNLRIFQDETVRGSYSYVSGHSSALFAIVTPIILDIPSRTKKVFFFSWGALHSFSRVYLVAHFPFCALMGSLMGITTAILLYKIFLPPKQNSLSEEGE